MASLAQGTDTGESGRFRRFSRDWIAERGDNLDIAWLKDEREYDHGDLPAQSWPRRRSVNWKRP